MNIRKLSINICDSIPILGCLMVALGHLFSSEISGDKMESGDKVDLGVASNSAAQKHFQKIQHIKTA